MKKILALALVALSLNACVFPWWGPDGGHHGGNQDRGGMQMNGGQMGGNQGGQGGPGMGGN
ncbi:hypothetical protein [Neisseria perflava]|uniref:hypothetical protein n=1 Tax=Neisseria perflava TaxID=33053 RepID=UPI0020A132DB|nr:hypothetical protein [Neisseria perflava]MCP1659887.1 hypothetical protein [Neisseria perflava]MCP1773356.1 hypothetical protein [Neisseria perflava]